MEKQDVYDLIDQDIAYQETKLKGDFKKDKPLHWRIIGLRYLREKIKELK